MKFSIHLNPSLEASTLLKKPIDFDEINTISIYRTIDEKIDIVYSVDQLDYGYYPSHILTALGDLNGEWESVCRRQTHKISLSGYPVLKLVFDSPRFAHFVSLESAESIGESISADCIETEFARATSAVWDYVKRKCHS